MEDLTAAVEKALRQQVHTRDEMVQFLPDDTPWRQTTRRTFAPPFTVPRGENRAWLGIDQAPGGRETAPMLLHRRKVSAK